MEWKLIGSDDVPAGFENVQIDENNLSQYREILRSLTVKALEDGTIKQCRRATQPNNGAVFLVVQKDHVAHSFRNLEKAKAYLGTITTGSRFIAEVDTSGKLKTDPHEVGGQDQGAGPSAGFNKYWLGWSDINSMMDVAKQFLKDKKSRQSEPLQDWQQEVFEEIERRKREWEAEVFKSLENDSIKKEMEMQSITPLMLTAFRFTTETCKKLISEGAEIDKISKVEPNITTFDGFNYFNTDEEDKISGLTALMWAAFHGELENVKLLISAGADISKETPAESESYGGCTALHYAAKGGNLEICKVLVSAGADIHKESKKGWTPLIYAATSYKENSWEMCKFFIEAGADIRKCKDELNLIILALSTAQKKPYYRRGIGNLYNKLALLEPDMIKNAALNKNALAFAEGEGQHGLYVQFVLLGANIDQEFNGWTPLTKAVYEGRGGICKLLISKGVNVNKEVLVDNEPKTALMLALNNRDSSYDYIAELLLKAGDIDQEFKDGWTPLTKAVYEGRDTLCEFLISAGANIDKEVLLNKEPTTALMLALNKGNDHVAKLLLKAGANTDKISKEKLELLKPKFDGNNSPTNNKDNEETPIYDTSKNIDEAEDLTEACNMKINKSDDNTMTVLFNKCKNFISAGANLDGSKVNTPLMNAASHGYTEICKMLMEAGANIDLQDPNGQTALMKTMVWNETLNCAGITENPEICHLLISGGADLNLQDSNGETALMKAAKNGLVNTCKILIAAGADVTMETSGKNELRGYTALHFSVLHAQYSTAKDINDDSFKEIFKMLISAGANIDQETAEGWTPLMVAAGSNMDSKIAQHKSKGMIACYSWDICFELISGGADINKKSKDGYTPLMIAMNKENNVDKKELCSKLIKFGADITTEIMPNGKTMLSWAASNYNFYDICEILLLRGADVNKDDEDGWTPLMRAACEENIKICDLFIEAGANVDKEILLNNKKPATALMLATMREYACICDFLVSAGANVLSTTYYSG